MVGVWTTGLAERWNWMTDRPEVSWPEIGFGEVRSLLMRLAG